VKAVQTACQGGIIADHERTTGGLIQHSPVGRPAALGPRSSEQFRAGHRASSGHEQGPYRWLSWTRFLPGSLTTEERGFHANSMGG
jgi:hypothetical protein